MDDLAGHDLRLSALEKSHAEMKSDLRVSKVQQAHIDERFDKLDNNVSKLAWLVTAAIVGAVMSFIMRGGLAPVG